MEMVIELANLASDRDPASLPRLVTALDSPAEPLRWWAAQGCTMLGSRAAPAETALRRRLTDESGAVRGRPALATLATTLARVRQDSSASNDHQNSLRILERTVAGLEGRAQPFVYSPVTVP